MGASVSALAPLDLDSGDREAGVVVIRWLRRYCVLTPGFWGDDLVAGAAGFAGQGGIGVVGDFVWHSVDGDGGREDEVEEDGEDRV